MTDSERDQIDQDAQIFMRTCSEAIKQLRNEGVCCFFFDCEPNGLKYNWTGFGEVMWYCLTYGEHIQRYSSYSTRHYWIGGYILAVYLALL